jgi:hypothetical protein
MVQLFLFTQGAVHTLLLTGEPHFKSFITSEEICHSTRRFSGQAGNMDHIRLSEPKAIVRLN